MVHKLSQLGGIHVGWGLLCGRGLRTASLLVIWRRFSLSCFVGLWDVLGGCRMFPVLGPLLELLPLVLVGLFRLCARGGLGSLLVFVGLLGCSMLRS